MGANLEITNKLKNLKAINKNKGIRNKKNTNMMEILKFKGFLLLSVLIGILFIYYQLKKICILNLFCLPISVILKLFL